METFIAGLLVASISGLALLAYRHPPGYKRLYIILMIAISAAYLLIGLWDIACEISYGQVITFLKDNAYDDARSAVRRVQINLVWTSLAAVGAYVYLNFLLYLPKLLENNEELSEEKNQMKKESAANEVDSKTNATQQDAPDRPIV